MRPRLVLSLLALTLGCELTLLFTLTRPRDPEGMALVSGTVRDPRGAPIRAGILTLPADIDGPACVSDEDGRFAVWLPAGRLRLVALAFGACESEPAELMLAPGERAELALNLRACSRISGVLRDPHGNPLADVSVSAWSGSVRFSCPDSWDETDAAGRFDLEGLHPGPVAVHSLGDAALVLSEGEERVLELVASAEALEEHLQAQRLVERIRTRAAPSKR